MAKTPGESGLDKRKARLARALRENLKRRKAQARAREEIEAGATSPDRNPAPGKPSLKS